MSSCSVLGSDGLGSTASTDSLESVPSDDDFSSECGGEAAHSAARPANNAPSGVLGSAKYSAREAGSQVGNADGPPMRTEADAEAERADTGG